MLPGVDAAVCAASLCAASPRVWCSAWCCCSPQRCLPVRNLSFLACWSETLFAVVLVLPHPSPPRLVSLPVCLCRVALFFLTLGRVVLEPVWRTSHCYGLVCSYPGWLLANLAFVSGCSFGSVGIQASVFPVHPLFCSVTLVFLAQLPVVSLDFGFNFFRLNLFPPCLLFPVQPTSLAALFLSILLYFL